ncbi:MAG: hypothetical protein ABSD63_06930 [Candidatus Korobacteraceae bacterium]|jgi:diadenosine tetraphosphate (Ap4A) HIT family hydrolase
MDDSCTFCAEFSAAPFGEFTERYENVLATRLIYNDGIFCSFPTVGQIRLGHLLLAPFEHCENFSQVIGRRRREFTEAFNEVRLRASAFGQVLAFEHGAAKSSGGACGVYHAHFHFVPLPNPVTVATLNLPVETYYPDLASALEAVRGRPEYIVGQDSRGKTCVLEGAPFGSQFLRKRIIETLSLDVPMDWRLAPRIEAQMLSAVKIVGGLFGVPPITGGIDGRTI